MNTLFSEVDRFTNPEKMDAESKRIYENSERASDPNYTVDPDIQRIFTYRPMALTAKYKIDLHFGPQRSTGTTTCLLQVFESGGKITEDNDQKCYFCWDIEHRELGCRGIIPASKLGDSHVVFCPNCKHTVNRLRLTGEVFYRLPIDTIAENVYKIFRQLNCDSDIYMKYDRQDIRVATAQGSKGLEPERLIRAREASIYTLQNIMKDVSNGSDILKKIKTFLKV